MTPTAPANWAFVALLAKEHGLEAGPRSISAYEPLREPAGSAVQANPSFPLFVMSTSGAWLAPSLEGKNVASLSCAEIFCGPFAAFVLTLGVSAWELVVAPTPITEGALAGLEIVLNPG